MASTNITEAQMVHLVRNTLIVAGHEMGHAGDHWPLINATIQDLMRDYERLQIERNVDAEMKIHLANWLDNVAHEIEKSPREQQAEMKQGLQELRDLYNAYFEPASVDTIYAELGELPPYVSRIKAIVETMEDTND